MKSFSLVLTLLTLCIAASCSDQERMLPREDIVAIVVSPETSPAEKIAARQLAQYLGMLYPNDHFEIVHEKSSEADHIIYLGCTASFQQLGNHLRNKELSGPESYVVTTAVIDGHEAGIIFGSDPLGVIYGVYGLLEELGCGFYLSYDAIPPARQSAWGRLSAEAFSFDGWQLSNAPLVQERIVFNWHNFLSGCSTWNLPDWEHWIAQTQKMGYNAVMVHAYGNNPMVSLSFNGVDKPVGYLTTTKKGRDWSTQHVNDVRRLWGGFVFDEPAFGTEAAMVPDASRTDAARRLMHDVFAYAEQRDMKVYFAVDVDTASANPQALIQTLPLEARFPITVRQMRWMNQPAGKMWLANPDTPQGYRYYKTQVEALLGAYPQINCLVLWFRIQNTPWMGMKLAEMPQSWQNEYQAELEKTPSAAKLWKSHNFFAIGKLVAAFDRALKEMGREDVQLAAGSWGFNFFPACDRFLPRHVKFIPLDYAVLHDRSQLRDTESRQVIREVGAHRPVIPVVWAHHDDGHYVGRSHTPQSDFCSKLIDSKTVGFGIIHWTTRPLDLYFKSLSKQVWQNTRNQPLRTTCNKMAERSFGVTTPEKLGEYMYRWVTEAPIIGRETTDWFIDRKLRSMSEVISGYEQRMKLLNGVEESSSGAAAANRLNYLKGLERFIIDIYRTEDALQRSRDIYRAGNIAAARDMMARCQPEAVIGRYARFSSLGGITRGEQGLVVSLNLRWLTHYVRHRQALGAEPVRYNFAPTSHDPLAQSMGIFTFHFESNRNVWECYGTKETGVPTFILPDDVNIARSEGIPLAYEEICRSGIESSEPITITLQPIMARGGPGRTEPIPLSTGRYRLHLLMVDPVSTRPGQRIFDVTVKTQQAFDWYVFEPVKAKYLRLACHGNSENDWNSICEVRIGSLDKDAGQDVVSASAAVENYAARNTIDGKLSTRWAAEGKDQWIQYQLDAGVTTDRIGMVLYQGSAREAKFEILVSDDNRQWSEVKDVRRSLDTLVTDCIDIFEQTNRASSVLVRSYPIELGNPGRVEVTLTPVHGKAVLCGAILEPTLDIESAERDESENGVNEGNIFSREKTISIMNRVNDYQLSHPWKPSDRNWIRATYYTGVMAFYGATADENILNQAMQWAEKHQWQPGTEQAGGNILTCGQTYLEIYFLKRDRTMIAPLIEWVNSGKLNAPSGQKVWYLEGSRRYADSLYVGPPTLAMLGKTTGDKKYLEYMHSMYWDIADLLFDKSYGLFYRDKRFIDAKSNNGKKVFWSRGNGWVIAGIPRILEYLPKNDPYYERYVDLLRTMAASIASVQGHDGLWRTNLDDANEYPAPETSGTAFFTYALAWGINNQILVKDRYLPVIKKAWNGLVRSVRPDGELGWVQPVGDRPGPVESSMTHEYAVGAFLLAGSEMLRLQQ